jgi:polyisoprenyl-teichoic acid--peptidoglycan teichoic acid transferase
VSTVPRTARATPVRLGGVGSSGPGRPRRSGRRRAGRKDRSRDPLWARLLVIFGGLLMLTSGGVIFGINLLVAQATGTVTQTNLLGDAGNQASHHVDINGPVNILLVGTDARPGQNPNDPVRSDSIIVVHVPASHDAAYMVSIPRDTLVQIPADAKTGYRGGHNKINSAFEFGAQNGGGIPGGVQLLGQTIKTLYGIGFDAAAVVDFAGFQQVVDVLGGVNMCVDEKTTSIHIGFTPDGKRAVPYDQSTGRLIPIKGVTPQVYNPGCQHLTPWQASTTPGSAICWPTATATTAGNVTSSSSSRRSSNRSSAAES